MRKLLIIILLCLLPLSISFAWEDEESFESVVEYPEFVDPFSGWPDEPYGMADPADGYVAHNLNGRSGKCVEVYWNDAGNEAECGYRQNFGSDQDYFRAQFYVKVYSDHANAELKFMRFYNNAGDNWILYLESGLTTDLGFETSRLANSPHYGSFDWADHYDEWHKVEVEVDDRAGANSFRLWVDDVIDMDITDVNIYNVDNWHHWYYSLSAGALPLHLAIDEWKSSTDPNNLGNGDPTATIVATDASALEQGTDTGTFTVTFSSAASGDTTVSYSVSGTATSGSDYTALSGTVVVSDGTTTGTITLTPIDDALRETSTSPETVIVTLSGGSGYTVGSPNSATVNISDNDKAMVLTICE